MLSYRRRLENLDTRRLRRTALAVAAICAVLFFVAIFTDNRYVAGAAVALVGAAQLTLFLSEWSMRRR